MGANLLTNYGEAVAIILFGIGFGNLLLQSNLIKKSSVLILWIRNLSVSG